MFFILPEISCPEGSLQQAGAGGRSWALAQADRAGHSGSASCMAVLGQTASSSLSVLSVVNRPLRGWTEVGPCSGRQCNPLTPGSRATVGAVSAQGPGGGARQHPESIHADGKTSAAGLFPRRAGWERSGCASS